MEFFERFFKRKKSGNQIKEEKEPSATSIIANEEPEHPADNEIIPDWADLDVTDEEKEQVAAIAVACLANSLPQNQYRVKRVLKVDEDWLVAGLAAISGVSTGEDKERYRIQSIKRVK